VPAQARVEEVRALQPAIGSDEIPAHVMPTRINGSSHAENQVARYRCRQLAAAVVDVELQYHPGPTVLGGPRLVRQPDSDGHRAREQRHSVAPPAQ